MRLHIPAFLNFECQACGGCCRDYEIALTEEEHQRLNDIDWKALNPELSKYELFGLSSGVHSAGHFRFGFKPDGTCAFLDGDGMCVMHKRLGFEPKALSCKLFPITFAATPTGVYVGCRFNCPAVAEGAGKPLERSRQSLEKLAEEYMRARQSRGYPEKVRFDRRQVIDWGDYMKLERAIINTLLRPDHPLLRKIRGIWRMADLMRQAQLKNVAGDRFGEFAEILNRGVMAELEGEEERGERANPSPPARMLFRQFLFFLLRRHGTPARWLSLRMRMRKRVEGLWTDMKYSFMFGKVAIFPDGEPVKMKDVMSVAPPALDGAAGALIERYLASKIFGKQIFGPLFFGYDFMRGFSALICVFSAILWYARASALSQGRSAAEDIDVTRAVEMVDYSFGYSPTPLLKSERMRISLLTREDTPGRLAAYYARARD